MGTPPATAAPLAATSPRNRLGLPRSPRFSHSRSQSSDSGAIKTRFLEQVHRQGLSSKSRGSLVDLASVFRQGANSEPASEHPQHINQSGKISNGTEELSFEDAVRSGRMAYRVYSEEVPDTNQAEAVMKVNRRRDRKNLDEVVQVLEELTEALARQVTAPMRGSSVWELRRLEQYLLHFSEDISRLNDDISAAIAAVKSQYSAEMRSSVDKLENLGLMLQKLQSRFEELRDRVQTCKDLMSNEMQKKIKLLQTISRRFAEHDQEARRLRVRQAIMMIFVVVVGFLAYVLGQGKVRV